MQTHSKFGGLWVDQLDAQDVLEARTLAGELSADLSKKIMEFMKNGYVVFRGAVSKDVTSKIRDELEHHYRSPPKEALVETWVDGLQQFVPPRPELREGTTKLLDFHAFSATARTAIAAPIVVEFLTAIFEEKPRAFQSLTFWRGSEQAIHKDTAYVQIEGAPMNLAASWLALEDIADGTGELEYYVGSHRDPDFLFAGHSKWVSDAMQEHDLFLASMHDNARKFSRRKASFLAREGDVLVWHADLAHGGSKITKPGRSRQSLVTHFTKSSNKPPYVNRSLRRENEVQGCIFMSQYADI